jgi:drug/metabolite transporter (DMT)-like permease
VPDSSDMIWLLCYGVLSHTFGALFLASSLPHVSTTEAGLALLLQPTLSFVWDVLFFDRPMQPVEIAGAAIALVAIYLGSRKAT